MTRCASYCVIDLPAIAAAEGPGAGAGAGVGLELVLVLELELEQRLGQVQERVQTRCWLRSGVGVALGVA